MPETRSIGEILRDAEAGRLEKILAEDREPYDLVGAAERLFALLDEREIDYALVGGIAMLQYVDGRNTRDIDLIMSATSLENVPELHVSRRDRDFARANFEGVQVDVLLTTNKLFEFVRKHHTRTADFGAQTVYCATPEGMLLLKLFALPSLYREGDNVRAAIYEADITGLLLVANLDIDRLLKGLRPHLLATDVSELRKVVEDIRTRGKGFSHST